MNLRHIALAVCFLMYGVTGWSDSSAAPTYTYTATTYADVKKAGNVRAGKLTWRCHGKRCMIKGPWATPAVGACKALARQVGRINYYGHSGKRLSGSQLNQCNAGLTQNVTTDSRSLVRSSVLSRPKYIHLPPPKVSGAKANDKKPAGPDLTNELSLIDVLSNKGIENDLRNFIGWDDKLIGDGALPGKVYYYVPREFLLVHDENGPSLRFTHRRTSGGSAEDPVIMKARLRAPYRPGDVALLRELAQSAIDRSGRKTIELRPLPIRSMEVVLEVLEKVYRVKPENIFILAAKDVDGSIDLTVRMSEMNMQEIISQIRHDELTGRVIISTGNGKVEVPFNLGLKRYAGQAVSSIEDIRIGKPLRNMGPFPLTIKGLVTYTKRGQGTAATLHRHYKRLRSGSIAPGRQRNLSLPPSSKLFPGQEIISAWFDYESDKTCRQCLDTVITQVSPEPSDLLGASRDRADPPSGKQSPQAKDEDGRGVQVIIEDKTGTSVGGYEGSNALLIGVSDYTAGWPDLESIPDELLTVQEVLEEQGFEVKRVLNPNAEGLEGAFKRFIEKYGYDENRRLFFFFSGHGYTRKEGNKGYLVPSDAPNPRKDENGFLAKALAMSQILEMARRIEVKHALFVFDSCFSGTLFKTKALPETPPHITDITARPVRQFITAGSANEEVPAKSIFTPVFVQGLRDGKADLNHDGYVTGTELGMYLHERVTGYDAQQTPQYGKIRDPDLDEGDFVFQLQSTQHLTK